MATLRQFEDKRFGEGEPKGERPGFAGRMEDDDWVLLQADLEGAAAERGGNSEPAPRSTDQLVMDLDEDAMALSPNTEVGLTTATDLLNLGGSGTSSPLSMSGPPTRTLSSPVGDTERASCNGSLPARSFVIVFGEDLIEASVAASIQVAGLSIVNAFLAIARSVISTRGFIPEAYVLDFRVQDVVQFPARRYASIPVAYNDARGQGTYADREIVCHARPVHSHV